MDYRLFEKNKIIAQLASLNAKIERTKKSKEDLVRSTVIRDAEFKQNQLKSNDECIEKYQEEKAFVEDRLHRLEKGELDDEIQEEINKNMKTINKKNEAARKKEEEAAKQDLINKQDLSRFNDKQRSSDYQNRQLRYESQKAYERFCTTEIPTYILDNLKTMPNNKGYIWKNIWCFGEKPAVYDRSGKPEMVVMFERQKDIMYIHEITEKEHHIFKKIGQQPRQYVSGVMRNNKFLKRPIF